MKTISICGIPHTIKMCKDNFDTDLHYGHIDHKACEIVINSDLTPESIKETLCHEIVHGMLVHMGYSDLSGDETFVQALGNAISQSFTPNVSCET